MMLVSDSLAHVDGPDQEVRQRSVALGGLHWHELETSICKHCNLSIPAYSDEDGSSITGLNLLAKHMLTRHPFNLLPQ